MSDNEQPSAPASVRPELASFRELELLVRHLGDELASFRRRALTAEARLKAITRVRDERSTMASPWSPPWGATVSAPTKNGCWST